MYLLACRRLHLPSLELNVGEGDGGREDRQTDRQTDRQKERQTEQLLKERAAEYTFRMFVYVCVEVHMSL